MHETCLIIIHDPGTRPGLESNLGAHSLDQVVPPDPIPVEPCLRLLSERRSAAGTCMQMPCDYQVHDSD